MSAPVLYLIACAAPPAKNTYELVVSLQKTGWDMCVIATPQATRFFDAPRIEALTGHPVRSDYKLPRERDSLPKADVLLVMPATFNTINKWVGGIGDTLAVSILCEALGRGTTPIIAVPCLKMDLVRHPVFPKNIAFLKECGVTVLHEPERYASPLMVPQEIVLEKLRKVLLDLDTSYAG